MQSHDDGNITNQIIDWTQGKIFLGPTWNLQGTYAFISLRTGSKITCSQFTDLPTSPRVTCILISMAMYNKQQKGLVFEYKNGVELPILGGGASEGITNNIGATGVDNIDNRAKKPYLSNNPYRDLADDEKNDNDDDGDDEI